MCNEKVLVEIGTEMLPWMWAELRLCVYLHMCIQIFAYVCMFTHTCACVCVCMSDYKWKSFTIKSYLNKNVFLISLLIKYTNEIATQSGRHWWQIKNNLRPNVGTIAKVAVYNTFPGFSEKAIVLETISTKYIHVS